METEERAALVRAKLTEMRNYEQRALAMAPPCSACVHYITGGRCGHLAVTQRTYRPVSGEWIDKTTAGAHLTRSEEGLCGPEGLLFELLSARHRISRKLAKDPFLAYISAIGSAVGLIVAAEALLR